MREILLKSFSLKAAKASIYNNKTQQLKLPKIDYNRYWSTYSTTSGNLYYTTPAAYTLYTTAGTSTMTYNTYTISTNATAGTSVYTLSY